MGYPLDDPKLTALLSLKLTLPGIKLKRERNRLGEVNDCVGAAARAELLPVLEEVFVILA
jgi:hypothetical protein